MCPNEKVRSSFGITSNSSPIWSKIMRGSVRRRPGDGCGLGRGMLYPAAMISSPPGGAPSHCSDPPDVITHMHPSHVPPPEPNRARNLWRS